MIKLGNKDITLKLGSTNISAAYLGSIQVYGGGHSYDLCYGVTDDISTYTGTFKDVFDKSSETWYKRNNLNEYEEYGVYGSGRNITTYEGKLTIDGDYEYQYTNGAWVNVGEVTGTTATLPDVPFTLNINAKNYNSATKTFAKTQGQLADTDVTITTGTVTPHDEYVTVTGETKGVISGYDNYFNRDYNNPNFTIISKHRTADDTFVHLLANRNSNYNWMYRPASTQLKFHGSSQINGVSVTTQPVIGGVRVDSSRNLIFNNYTDNTTTTSASFSYGSTNSGGVALFAGYVSSGREYFNGDFYWIYVSQNTLTDAQVQQVINYNEGGGSSEYPIYYDEKADPLDNLTFNSLADAEAYAYANCVYDGMKATIDGEKYVFDSTNGWTLVPEYYKVEDITPGGASGWTITGSSTYNPNSSYYDDFSVVNATTSYVTKIAKVTIYGYDHFTYYLRSYGYSNYAFAYATNVDELSSDPTTNFGYNSSSAITNTYGFTKAAGSAVNLSNYRRVTYNNLDKNVEHTFYVIFYGRARNTSQNGNATILIPKEQSNENWEQVEFSASTNIASTQKGLYIDGNTSTSGGTNQFYYRWIIGLPSGTHTGYTNYSNYNYCPSVSSATFTSVAGNSRQVNFVYDAIQTKSLQFNLVDSSGNTLTPSNDVYYYIQEENSCGAAQRINVRMPNSAVPLPVGGRFNLQNKGNFYDIYGYTPTQDVWNYHYTDNYTTNFDIVYTKLSEEAVTLSYVTYDPNDSETPSFMTEVTYPYNGGTTSATTLTSFNVPYTYPYTIEQTSNLFSADTYTYTAGQASRTITFTLYPNNREFQTVTDLEAYQYAWEGMKAYIGSTDYQYENGQWVEITFTELQYCIVPKVQTPQAFTIKNKIQQDYIYTFEFTPNNGFYDNFYGMITTTDANKQFSDYGIYKLDNGWGAETRRNRICFYNFHFDARSDFRDAFRFYVGAKATVTLKLHNSNNVSEGTDLTLINEGYSTVNLTSTKTFSTGYVPQSGEYDMLLFSDTGYTNNSVYSAPIWFHRFTVTDTLGNTVYDYVPKKRDIDNVVGLFDNVNNEFYVPTGFTFTAGPAVSTLQWVTFNSGDDISGLNIYGIKGNAQTMVSGLGVYILLTNNSAIRAEQVRNNVNIEISGCYSEDVALTDDVEYIFSNIGCSDYFTSDAGQTAGTTFQLYIYQ